ncbi:MAG: hypothetical protein ACHQQQ_10415 [Bacteroidota bacterium]
MSELDDALFTDSINRGYANMPYQLAQKAFHEEATAFLKEQRALVKKQERYAKLNIVSVIVTMIATIVIAVATWLQYNRDSKMDEFPKIQVPQLQQVPSQQLTLPKRP